MPVIADRSGHPVPGLAVEDFDEAARHSRLAAIDPSWDRIVGSGRTCPCCGEAMTTIGQEVTEELDYHPGSLFKRRHIRPKYACKQCEGVEDDGPTVRIMPPPVQLIPKSIATERLLAHVAVSKFADALANIG